MKLIAGTLMWRKLMWMAGCLALLLLATGCTDDDDDVEPTPVAYVSLYHGSPDAPDLDVIVDNRRVNGLPFDYAEYTGYLQFFTGERELKFTPVNADNALVDTLYTFEKDEFYSAFVADELERIEVLIVNDSAGSPATGNAMVRFIHLSPDAAATDLFVADESFPLFEGVSFKEARNFTEVTADTYAFEVRASSGGEGLLSVPDVELKTGQFYTIILRGFASPPAGNDNILSVQVINN